MKKVTLYEQPEEGKVVEEPTFEVMPRKNIDMKKAKVLQKIIDFQFNSQFPEIRIIK